MNLKKLIQEEVKRQLKESLTVKDWDEYSYPKAYVMITLSNNKKLTISPQRIPGGKKAYEDMLRVLRDYNYDKRANDYIDNLISQMA